MADDSLGYDFRLSSLFADNKGGERFMHVLLVVLCVLKFLVLCVSLNFKVVCVCLI